MHITHTHTRPKILSRQSYHSWLAECTFSFLCPHFTHFPWKTLHPCPVHATHLHLFLVNINLFRTLYKSSLLYFHILIIGLRIKFTFLVLLLQFLHVSLFSLEFRSSLFILPLPVSEISRG